MRLALDVLEGLLALVVFGEGLVLLGHLANGL